MSDSAEQSISSALQATETVSDPGGVPIDCNTRTFNTSLYGPTPSSNSSSGGSTSTAPYGYPSLNARASSPASSISDHVGSRKKLSSKKDIPYVCLHPGCSRAFARMYDLDRHCKTHYPQTTQKFDCPEAVKGSFCGRMGDRGFTRNDHLNEHLRKVHHYDIRTRDTCELSAMPHPSSIRHLTSPRTGPSILPKPVINRTPLVDYSALSAGAWDSHVPPSYRISASDTLGEEQAT